MVNLHCWWSCIKSHLGDIKHLWVCLWRQLLRLLDRGGSSHHVMSQSIPWQRHSRMALLRGGWGINGGTGYWGHVLWSSIWLLSPRKWRATSTTIFYDCGVLPKRSRPNSHWVTTLNPLAQNRFSFMKLFFWALKFKGLERWLSSETHLILQRTRV